MNPLQVAKNRSTRLVAEARQGAVAYSTVTPPAPKREHLVVIEWESDLGGRYWSKPLRESLAEAEMAEARGYSVSDYDHAASCWCDGEDFWAEQK